MVLAPAISGASFTPYFDLSLLGDGYLQPVSKDVNNSQLHGRFKLLSSEEKKTIFFDLGAGGLVGEKAESYFIIPQAYVQFIPNEKYSITVGRSVKTYSAIDDYWMLGDIQPVFRWDTVHPEQQGLSGVFVDMKVSRNLDFNVYGSGLFLPTQGPSYSLVGGKLTSSNPWFTEPIDSLRYGGQLYDLSYSIKTPDVSDIIIQPSWGLGFTAKSDNEALWMRANYFSKTRNDLILPLEVVLNIGNQTSDITVHPETATHKITSLDFGYRGEKWNTTISGLYESDVNFSAQGNWVRPNYSDQYKLGFHLLGQVTPTNTLEFGALKTFNNTVKVRLDGIAGNFDIDAYTYRNQYDNALDLRWSSVFSPRPHGFLYRTKMRYAYDYKAETSLVSLEVNYRPLASLTLFALTDFFGGDRDKNLAYNNLLVNYLNRDRAQAGVRYVF